MERVVNGTEIVEENKYDGFYTQIYQNGCALITLSRPKKLNALSYTMLRTLFELLYTWRDVDSILFIVFRSDSKKSFCAGGDMIGLADPIYDISKTGYAEWQFIGTEYRLDLLIATYNKPILSLLNGIVMGGGAGLGINAHYSIVTDNVRFGMPEINVFYFGDCLVTYHLSKLNYNFGKFLMCTAQTINYYEMLQLHLAQFYCSQSGLSSLLSDLTVNRFGNINNIGVLKGNIEKLLTKYHHNGLGSIDSNELNKQATNYLTKVKCVGPCFSAPNMYEIYQNINEFINDMNNPSSSRDLAVKIKDKLENVSPLSALLAMKLLERAKLGSIYDNAIDNLSLTCKLLTEENYGRGTREWMTQNMRNKKNVERTFPFEMTLQNSQYLTNDILDLFFELPANYNFKLEFNSNKKQWNVVDIVKNPKKWIQLPVDDIKYSANFVKSKL